MEIQERSSKDANHREVCDYQERHAGIELTNADVELELAKSLHRPIRSVDERRAPSVFDGSAPQFGHI